MWANLPPFAVFFTGALLVTVAPARLHKGLLLLVPMIAGLQLLGVPEGHVLAVAVMDYELIPYRVDRLSLLFGYIFTLAAFIGIVFSLHLRDRTQHVAGLVYAGSALGAVLAGDLISVFVYWELAAISSVFLIWSRRTPRAVAAGWRYLVFQFFSGLLLLTGILIRFHETGSLAFDYIGLNAVSGWLLFTAFGIKCAFPLLHSWLTDAYPEATPTGTVFLSAFTTKAAVYMLARGFPGTEILIYIGVTMTIFPIFYAVIENNLRRVLAYSLNNQLGFMVVGIGIGTELSLNGTAAHAFCHIIYKALLFMSMGAVLYRVGTTKATELGGLHKSMPLTTIFCIIGAGSIAGFPLLSGFISKSMIISAAGEQHMFVLWILLLVASAGVMEHSGIKIPFFAFFAHDSGKRVKEAPWNMLLGMFIAAFFCVALGIYYPALYRLLPYQMDHAYEPYTAAHVIMQLQLLLFAALAFVFLLKTNLYPAEVRSTNLDTDWIYRKFLPWLIGIGGTVFKWVDNGVRVGFLVMLNGLLKWFGRLFNERGPLGSTWSTSLMAFWAAILLGVCLLLYYF